MRLTSLPLAYGIDPWGSETAQQLPLGAIGFDYYGNKYHYVANTSTLLVAGNLIQSVVQPSNFVDLAVQAAAPLRTTGNAPGPNYTVALTLGGTAVTSNQFAGGRFIVSVTPGLGTQYTIKNHDVQTNTSGTCNFTFYEPLAVALTTSSKASVVPNPYNGVVQSPTSPTGFSVGIAIFAIPANTTTPSVTNYGWVGCTGVFGALNDNVGGTSVGNTIAPSTTTAGCITKGVTLKDNLGYYLTAPTSGEVEPQWFNIG